MRETVTKGWGEEDIWVKSPHYASKFLRFKKGGTSSMHFHKEKHEHWYVMSGTFTVTYINITNGERWTEKLKTGDVTYIPTMQPHQVHCNTAGVILEVSMPDTGADNYRVEPGDTQKQGLDD